MSASGVWWSGEKGVSGLESGLLIWVLCPLSLEGLWAVKAGGVDLVLRAVGGVWSACGGVVGSCGVLWADTVKNVWGCGKVLLRLWGCFLLRHQLHKSCLGLLLVANPLQLNR